MTLSLRGRLIAVVVLAALACGGALFAIAVLAAGSSDQRLDRARDAVVQQVERLREARENGTPWDVRQVRRTARRIQSGFIDGPNAGANTPGRDDGGDGDRDRNRDRDRDRNPSPGSSPGPGPGPGPGPEGMPRLRAIARDAIASNTTGRQDVIVRTVPVTDGTAIVAVGLVSDGGYAWAGSFVIVPRGVTLWRLGVIVLAVATLLLVLVSLQSLVSLQRGAGSLRASLAALATNLRAAVDRPSVRELASVADGIASLAAELSRAQDEQTRLTRALAERERLAGLGRVAAGVAHEVRNPLAAIKLRVDLARRNPTIPAALSNDLGDISSEVARLDRLVVDLLAVAGSKKGPRTATDVAGLVQRRVALLAQWADARDVTVEVDAPSEAVATVDADSLARAVDNLVRNAVEASPTPGTVSVSVRGDATTVSLAVVDRGPGVPEARAAELFEPFFTTKPEGTGLGLALSRSIAAAHQGTLTYERADNATRFGLTIARTAPPTES